MENASVGRETGRNGSAVVIKGNVWRSFNKFEGVN